MTSETSRKNFGRVAEIIGLYDKFDKAESRRDLKSNLDVRERSPQMDEAMRDAKFLLDLLSNHEKNLKFVDDLNLQMAEHILSEGDQ